MNANRRKFKLPSSGGVAKGRGGFVKMTKDVKRRILLGGAMVCCLLLAGCDGGAQRDALDEKNPHVQKGLEQTKMKHWDEAIRQFGTALQGNTSLARPNLELALIYHQQKKNYVRAVYHYERYLEKRPDSQKAPLISDWIRQAKISFAAQIGQTTGSISEELVRLTRENNLLRKQLEKTTDTRIAAPVTKPVLTQSPIAKPEPTPVSAQPVQRIQTPAPITGTYKVLPGDTLTRIAKAVYGNSSQWKEIYGANLDKMKNENDLKAGQTIIIPKL